MVIGNGMIARAFKNLYEHDNKVIIFASGVSNSSETNDSAFNTETQLLLDCLKRNGTKRIVYFSTCSIYDNNNESPYVRHKKRIEKLIIKNSRNYLIFRLPQVVGKSTNNHTLINHLYNKIQNGEPITVWKGATRNLIDIEDVVKISSYIIEADYYNNTIINIASKYNVGILEIVRELENITKNKADIVIEERISSYSIDISRISPVISKLGINFPQIYYKHVIHKYYK